MTKNNPLDMKLYNKVKSIAKKKFKVWPSAYASGWVVKEYKRRGGLYSGKNPNKDGLQRWFTEEWINVCELPKKVKCGRPNTDLKNWKKEYPYCRPLYKITHNTPKTVSKFSKKQLKKLCKSKRKSPMKILTRKKRDSITR